MRLATITCVCVCVCVCARVCVRVCVRAHARGKVKKTKKPKPQKKKSAHNRYHVSVPVAPGLGLRQPVCKNSGSSSFSMNLGASSSGQRWSGPRTEHGCVLCCALSSLAFTQGCCVLARYSSIIIKAAVCTRFGGFGDGCMLGARVRAKLTDLACGRGLFCYLINTSTVKHYFREYEVCRPHRQESPKEYAPPASPAVTGDMACLLPPGSYATVCCVGAHRVRPPCAPRAQRAGRSHLRIVSLAQATVCTESGRCMGMQCIAPADLEGARGLRAYFRGRQHVRFGSIPV